MSLWYVVQQLVQSLFYDTVCLYPYLNILLYLYISGSQPQQNVCIQLQYTFLYQEKVIIIMLGFCYQEDSGYLLEAEWWMQQTLALIQQENSYILKFSGPPEPPKVIIQVTFK